MVAKYIGSMIAKRVLKNNPQLHKKFDDLFDNQTDLTSSVDSRISQALGILRKDTVKSKLPQKSIGGEVEIKKGSEYIKDLL